MKGCRSNVTLAARGTLSTQVLVSNTILQRNGLILGLGQEIYKLSLEHLVTESKKVLKTKQNKTPKETKKKNPTIMGVVQKDTGANRKGSQWPKLK